MPRSFDESHGSARSDRSRTRSVGNRAVTAAVASSASGGQGSRTMDCSSGFSWRQTHAAVDSEVEVIDNATTPAFLQIVSKSFGDLAPRWVD
jgi:hypothetical protein